MKKFIPLIVAMLYSLIVTGMGNGQLGGQVFYKYGTVNLKDGRGGLVEALLFFLTGRPHHVL